jgi:hypothetical protein
MPGVPLGHRLFLRPPVEPVTASAETLDFTQENVDFTKENLDFTQGKSGFHPGSTGKKTRRKFMSCSKNH